MCHHLQHVLQVMTGPMCSQLAGMTLLSLTASGMLLLMTVCITATPSVGHATMTDIYTAAGFHIA